MMFLENKKGKIIDNLLPFRVGGVYTININ